jgi:hypothetical protein
MKFSSTLPTLSLTLSRNAQATEKLITKPKRKHLLLLINDGVRRRKLKSSMKQLNSPLIDISSNEKSFQTQQSIAMIKSPFSCEIRKHKNNKKERIRIFSMQEV